jgi:transposase
MSLLLHNYFWGTVKDRFEASRDQAWQSEQERFCHLYFEKEFFGWRNFSNRREVGACAGLTPTPYNSGRSRREQGMSKAGNKRIRKLIVEISWCWLRYQPRSELSRWFTERFAHGGKRMRRIGIVALARKLLIALWRFRTHGLIPEGARLKAIA